MFHLIEVQEIGPVTVIRLNHPVYGMDQAARLRSDLQEVLQRYPNNGMFMLNFACVKTVTATCLGTFTLFWKTITQAEGRLHFGSVSARLQEFFIDCNIGKNFNMFTDLESALKAFE